MSVFIEQSVATGTPVLSHVVQSSRAPNALSFRFWLALLPCEFNALLDANVREVST
jgi:hypothetical protein